MGPVTHSFRMSWPSTVTSPKCTSNRYLSTHSFLRRSPLLSLWSPLMAMNRHSPNCRWSQCQLVPWGLPWPFRSERASKGRTRPGGLRNTAVPAFQRALQSTVRMRHLAPTDWTDMDCGYTEDCGRALSLPGAVHTGGCRFLLRSRCTCLRASPASSWRR